MKKAAILILLIFFERALFGQLYDKPVTVNPGSGYVTINEVNSGYGLGGNTIDYSQYFMGFTSTHGYRLNIYGLNVNSSVTGSAGVGVFLYNGGILFPLFGDVRYTLQGGNISPYIFVRSGLLINLEDISGKTRIFIHGGPGIRLAINDHFSLNISPGLMVQMGNYVWRDAFVNFNVGIVFKPLENKH